MPYQRLAYLLFFLVKSLAILSVDRIETCLLDLIEKSKPILIKKDPALFHLHFGDPAVEIFNVINKSDIKRIKHLAKCVELEDSSLLEDTKIGTNGTLIHQGKITFLNGIFQQLLPDIIVKLQIAVTHGIEGAEWDTSHVKNLGIRLVQYSAIDTTLKMKSKAELAQIKKDYQHVFVIGEDKAVKVDDGKVDTHADEHVSRYMRREPDSVYTMMINLSSRSEYFGGIVLIKKDEKDEDWHREHGEEEIEEDDENIFDVWENESNSTDDMKTYVKPEFNAYHTTIQRYTPELGSALLIRSESSHGVHKVTRGKLNTLVLEFWPYADSPVGSKFQSKKDAKSLTRSEEL